MTQEQGERPTADTLTSGEMVRASGLSIKALRLYDANGLLVPAGVDPRTGYRAYAPEQVERARALALLRRIDVPLARVPEVLDADPRDVRDVLLGWWDEQQQALAEQRATAEELARRLAVRRGDAEVRWREVPACTVATITSSTTQADLVPTFSADLLTIRAHLAAAGAEAGAAHWVIYHSPVGRDVPGRVEACVPYRGAVVPAGPVVLREDPARTEAYVEVPSRDCRFPQIVGYLDALRVGTGLAHATSREVYAVPWSDEPDAIVAEVALAVGLP
ncbi:MerR family transcriptional regulator [Cellulosimicrobium cellulans]|uniref:MerR family transcriptional regulator n=1 Tax=Cellulosimicrobium cellulans TaxID=1710 RepID=A0A4Y4DX91_CELCE|nr:MerR family transcriptional regulator [Cellulosimicrobium cellulans]GED09297.1 MerR family transcriptional regulator [Cellulosimicrobium cellulans]